LPETTLIGVGELCADVRTNSPMNMLPFTNAPRLPNIGLTSTRSSSGTSFSNRARSASLGFGIFISSSTSS
jgi:hypothetical protein